MSDSWGAAMSDSVTTTERRHRGHAETTAVRATWTGTYLRIAALLDCLFGLAAGLVALEIRFDSQGSTPAEYFAFAVALPFLWLGSVAVAGGYDTRFIGGGSDEFRRGLHAAAGLTAWGGTFLF